MINTIEKLAAYNIWANDTLLAHMDKAVAGGAEIPAVALRLFSHVLNAQAIWIARLTDTQSPVKVWQEHTLQGLHELHAQTSDRLLQMAQAADDTELHRMITYTNSVGDAYVSQVSDVLTHVHVHANYHRGQVATRLRDNELEPINTDFITYCREMSAKETVSL